MIEIRSDDFDAAEYVRIVENYLNNFIRDVAPDEILVVKIDNWFDHKWRNFAGKFLGAVGFWNETVLRIPPFIPDRVVEQRYFEKHGDEYQERERAGLHIYQSSGENITGKRKLVAFGRKRLLFWFSGNSKNALRGSLMIYRIEKENSSTVYVSFVKKENWQIYKTDGISRQEAKSLI